ncbi:hypothetical protein [Gudongella sp. SC589]|jgi:hypothetical protein|uniref:hypothetical protein n=1 Tax=Gudongella sp. SC589 TaxID=3385990 RepID=UPI0039048896
MNIINDIILVNKEIAQKSKDSIMKNPEVLLLGVVYSVMSIVAGMLVFNLLAGLGILLGIIYALVESAIVSSYLFVLHNVVVYNRFRWRDIKHGFTYYIRKVYGVLFIFYLANLILGFLSNLLGPMIVALIFIIGIGALVVLNPLPEALYVKDRDSLQTILYCVDFMKENWINWLFPNIILTLILYLLTGGILNGGLNPFRGLSFSVSISSIVLYLIGSAILSTAMIYRGHLFKLLSTTTLRKRMFMRKL